MQQSNLQQINNLQYFLNSKQEMIQYWEEFPFGFNLLIDDMSDFKNIITIINNQNNKEEILPIMRLSNGDDILCLNKGMFCIYCPFDRNYSNIIIFDKLDDIWDKFIKPYVSM